MMFFENWYGIVRIMIVAPLAYASLVFTLRISGKRTLAKMNAFDFVVTVALGSTLATVIMSKDVPLAEGGLAFLILAALQYTIAWAAQRVAAIKNAIKSEPQILLLDGAFNRPALLNERVTEDEVKAAVRKSGIGDLAKVAAVVMETDGSFSVISLDAAGQRSAFPNS